ncbi:MAG: hypothetical protein KBS95_06740 [Alistipes sp.]|nr:hypothetical protein [Candidatus Alistipes equi]
MKVIIESGATKSVWALIEGGNLLRTHSAVGMNLSAGEMTHIKNTITSSIKELSITQLEGMYIYTAGVISESIQNELEGHIRALIAVQKIEIHDDLFGAARALFHHGEGIAAILGTGSNTCFYDGKKIERRVYSGGYIIGDDGSAAALGRIFLSDFIKGETSHILASEFCSQFDSSYKAIVEEVYHSPSPSKYLGSIAPLIVKHYYDDAYAQSIIDENFIRFIRRSLLKYPTSKYEVGIVGGFGSACKDIFLKLALKEGIVVHNFCKEPIEGLISYHCHD